MASILSLGKRCGQALRRRCAALGGAGALAACAALAGAGGSAPARDEGKPAAGAAAFRFPTVPAEHKHARALLENALRYLDPQHGMIDKASGYPLEGWNHDPKQAVFLRSFTQLTAVGQCMELLGNIAAGQADTPFLTREQALERLTHLVKSLRQDQKDPRLSADGLLGNFLDLATGKRLGPLASDVDKQKFLEAFGKEKGEALWRALQAKGWLAPRKGDREAAIERGPRYGEDFFDGPLKPYADKATRQKVMDVLDRRVVMVVLGDNANLSMSAAKTVGALLLPEVKDRPAAAALRRELEAFLDGQRAGYARLYDREAGLFYFGRDATRDRLFGWEDLQGKWKTGHSDYLVNEFRAPATFVIVRYNLPARALANLGFKIKPYRTQDGRELYALAPWEGSAFQAMGLGLSLRELDSPSWRRLLENVVDIEIDFAARKKLPGFLSESYTGQGAQYTGNVDVPDIAVTPKPRITDAASLYTLGTAYSIAPERTERFLAANWPVVSKLLTDHGPWEGFNVTRQEVIRFQTSAHTFALILGLLGTGPAHMNRYLGSRGLGERLDGLFKPGAEVELLSDKATVFAWADKDAVLRSTREKGAFQTRGDRVKQLGVALVTTRPEGVNLSGCLLRLRYRSAQAMDPVLIALKPAGTAPAEVGVIPKEIVTRLAATGGREAEIAVPLPATPGLTNVREVVLTHEQKAGPVDLSLTYCGFTPIGPARAAPRRPER
jgi:hypothetical protein